MTIPQNGAKQGPAEKQSSDPLANESPGSTNAGSSDGAQKSDPAALSARASRDKTLSKAFEVLAVVILTALLGVFWLPSGKTVFVITLVLFGLVFLYLAYRLSFSAMQASKELSQITAAEANLRKHVITETRIKTMIQANVPWDVTEYLSSLVPPSAGNGNAKATTVQRYERTTGELVADLKKEFGPERANEVKDDVLKYTELETEPASQPTK